MGRKDSNNKNINMAIGDVQKKQIQLLDLWDKKIRLGK